MTPSMPQRLTRVLPVGAICVFLAACHEPAPAPAVEAPAPPDRVHFVDIAEQAGLDRVTACGNPDKQHLLEALGSGAALADYDADGDLDLFVGTAQPSDAWLAGERPLAAALYRNEGGGRFLEVAEQAGISLRDWTLGTYFVDYDGDGDKDLFVTRWGDNGLYRNEGDGTFRDVTDAAGVAGAEAWSAGAAFGDLDGDGDLDLYVANYCEYDLHHPPLAGETMVWQGLRVYVGPIGLQGEPDELYRNNGDGTFTEIAVEAGIDDHTQPLFGLGVVMSDLDLDGDLDIFVANDSVPNYLWRNEGGLRFVDVALAAGVATNESAKEQAGMGVDSGDYDGDGLFDLVVTNFSQDFNTLHRNHGDLAFVDATFEARFSDSYDKLGWGTRFFDYDHDGLLDLFQANGHIYSTLKRMPQAASSYTQPNSLYRNLGDGRFENRTATAGDGLAIVRSSRGVAVGDIDGDGDLDVALTNIDSTPNLLINRGGNRGAWLSVRLSGTASNRDGVGARLMLEAAGRRWSREMNPFGSYLSQSEYAVHFGLGAVERIDRLTVHWPSGATDVVEGLAARRHVVIGEGEGLLREDPPRQGWTE